MPPRRLGEEETGSGQEGGEKKRRSCHSPEHKVEGGLLLDVVVGESATILELLAGEDQALLVGGDTGPLRSVLVVTVGKGYRTHPSLS